MKFGKKKKDSNSQGWLLTYSDMITLVLAFLAILIGSKNIGLDVKPFIEVFNGNVNVLNTGHGQDGLLNVPSIIHIPKKEQNKNSSKKRKDIEIELNKILITKNIKFEKTARGIRVFLFDNFFFDFNNDKLNLNTIESKKILKNARDFLDTLFNEIELTEKNKIIFEGYADNEEDNPFLLSFLRAHNIINAIFSIESPYPLNKKIYFYSKLWRQFVYRKRKFGRKSLSKKSIYYNYFP